LPLDLQNLLPHLPVWLLVLFRLTGLFVIAPLFSSLNIPGRVKIVWALTLSFCIYPTLLAQPQTRAMLQPMLEGRISLLMLPAAVALELLIGVILGFGASLPLAGMQVAGQIVDQQVGTGLAGILNPDMGDEQSGVFSQFYFLLALALLLILGGHRVILSSLLDSYAQVPLAGFRPDARLAELLVGLLTSMFELALRISAPLLCLVFLETVAVGFIARTMPQLNLMSVGYPLRIIVGIGMLMASLSSNALVAVHYLQQSLRAVAAYLGA